MKKVFALLGSILLGFSLAACSQPTSSTQPPPPLPSSSVPAPSQPAPSAPPASSSLPATQNLAQNGNIEGTWTVNTISFEGMTFTAAELESALGQAASLTGSGMESQAGALELVKTLTLTLQADGTGQLKCTLDGKETDMPFTWEGQNGRYTFTDGSGGTNRLLLYEDDTLSYSYGSFELLLNRAG